MTCRTSGCYFSKDRFIRKTSISVTYGGLEIPVNYKSLLEEGFYNLQERWMKILLIGN
jgi:hypothetical protein